MGRLGELRTVIMEDVGVVMDLPGVGSRVRLLFLFLLFSLFYLPRLAILIRPYLKNGRSENKLINSGRMSMPPCRGECTLRSW